jgi:superfamily II DNA or RNA helicase
MSLRHIQLISSLNTSEHSLVDDFFVPLLSRSVKYDRAVGFFSSAWLRENSKGMLNFARNGGRARWITSPILSEQDWHAMQRGVIARGDYLDPLFMKSLDEIEEELESDVLNALAWMVADGVIDFKLAIPHSKLDGGDFHTKMGVFVDTEGNEVGFTGSYNDSIQGLRNYESINVYWDWEQAHRGYVGAVKRDFDRLWNNRDPNVEVFDLPRAARERILRLRSTGRPGKSDTIGKEEPGVGQLSRNSGAFSLRDYQETAIEAWFNNGCRGLLEMATGTGKTITALAAVRRRLDEGSRRIVVIACPFSHLVDQWADEATRFGFDPLVVGSSFPGWEQKLASELRRYSKERIEYLVVITTIGSLILERFNEALSPFYSEVLFVADEAHNLGAGQARDWLKESIPDRLALSATPLRQFDDAGNAALSNYFGGPVFTLNLSEAIGRYLTEYEYYPTPVELTDDEFEEYCNLSRMLSRFARGSEDHLPEAAKRIAIKRARLLNNSIAKVEWVGNHIRERGAYKHVLFYAGDKIFDPLLELLGYKKDLKIHEFTGRQTVGERRSLLARFEAGDLQALVAMKCLDEGVDVPPTRTAYFLASSGNPREFIQRRGRVLRKSPGKTHAVLHDLISVPPSAFLQVAPGHADFAAVRSAVRREYRRIKEFAALARNGYHALQPFFELADHFELLGEE